MLLPDDSEPEHKPERLEQAIYAIVNLLDEGTAPDTVAKKVADWSVGEVCSLREI